ncbi:tubulin-folding cofactor C-like [Papaver somniferum]|uniref:tubulin-folding cofactor C-like n=1 Tax=Papaver somniferum TaxID=3469 RepID=UPI000E705030|nr:tubulin-folding cofactor C-like [Papaver somniferum]
MEENQSNNPADKPQDTIAQKKHAAMIERLSNLHQSRLQQAVSRKSDSNDLPAFESTKSFTDRFYEFKKSIETEINRCRLVTDPESKANLKSDLDKLSISISELEKLVAENSYFLPSYEVRASLKTICDLKETLDSVSFELLPKKKFSFRNKSTAAKKDQVNVVTTENENSGFDSVLAEKCSIQVRDSPGFRNKEGVVLVKSFGSSKEGDFTLSDLNSCEVRVTGCFRALYIHRLRNCRVYVGPVMGSILIEQAEDCLFMMASHQMRIHHAKKTDFYLRVRSRPIIEDCNSVTFAPYLLRYEGIDKDLKDSSLDEETGSWANVDDFKWLRAVQSPNWSILPEEERVSAVNISNLETPSDDI